MNYHLERLMLIVIALVGNVMWNVTMAHMSVIDIFANPINLVLITLLPPQPATWLIYGLFPCYRKWVRETDEWIFADVLPAIYEHAAERGVILSDETLELLGDRMLYVCKRDFDFDLVNLEPAPALSA